MPPSTTRPSEVVDRHRQAIRDIVRRHDGVNPRIFGSVARGEDTATSDLDLLVDHGAERALSLFDLASIDLEVGALLNIPVQTLTPASLPPKVRAIVEREAIPL